MLRWDERYRLGNLDIDMQHRKLFELVNNLSQMAKIGITPELSRIIEELKAYARLHFKFEESVFSKSEYHNIDSHIRAHDKFIFRVNSFERILEENKEDLDISIIVNFLNSWLITHILQEDMEYKRFILTTDITHEQ